MPRSFWDLKPVNTHTHTHPQQSTRESALRYTACLPAPGIRTVRSLLIVIGGVLALLHPWPLIFQPPKCNWVIDSHGAFWSSLVVNLTILGDRTDPKNPQNNALENRICRTVTRSGNKPMTTYLFCWSPPRYIFIGHIIQLCIIELLEAVDLVQNLLFKIYLPFCPFLPSLKNFRCSIA